MTWFEPGVCWYRKDRAVHCATITAPTQNLFWSNSSETSKNNFLSVLKFFDTLMTRSSNLDLRFVITSLRRRVETSLETTKEAQKTSLLTPTTTTQRSPKKLMIILWHKELKFSNESWLKSILDFIKSNIFSWMIEFKLKTRCTAIHPPTDIVLWFTTN